MTSEGKRGRGVASTSADLYTHFTRRADLGKSGNYYYVVCNHCARAYSSTSQGSVAHALTGKRAEAVKPMRNVIKNLTRHVETCVFAQASLNEDEYNEANEQPLPKFQRKLTEGPMDMHAKPLLNAPLSATQEHEWQLQLLHMTVALGLPFSWIESPEAITVIRSIRNVYCL